MPASFLFYDLETFGADPRRSRIAQFAAIRTDSDLNPVEDPIDVIVRPADDLLPSPIATLITGITPQRALAEGVPECEAFARIFDAMARPETCTLGYNSLRFDDEFVRFGLYRNFHDAYEREWRGGNSRWDLLDVMRLAHALRPDGLVWPLRDDGAPSFKLEHLADANRVREGMAHEALSDVRALIGIARLFKRAQPRLWDYTLKLRDKRFAASLLDTVAMTPVLHVSQRFPAARLCAAAVAPLARHPQIDSRVIVYDLHEPPDALLSLPAEAIAERLYVRSEDLAPGETRIPLKEVHTNRSPMLVAWPHLRDEDFARLRIDPALAEARCAQLRAAGPALAEKIRRVYALRAAHPAADADGALYDGFLPDSDRRRFAEIRSTPPEALGVRDFGLQDTRLVELLFRYRARNWPQTLTVEERARWDDYRRLRLGIGEASADAPSPLSEYTLAGYRAEIQALRAQQADAPAQALLDALDAWGDTIAGTLG
jgi:exodeoxyribonuclease-1